MISEKLIKFGFGPESLFKFWIVPNPAEFFPVSICLAYFEAVFGLGETRKKLLCALKQPQLVSQFVKIRTADESPVK
jgi:hypothetical protein